MDKKDKVDPGKSGISKTTEVTKDTDYEVDSAGRRPGDPGYDKPVRERPDQDLPGRDKPADPHYGQEVPTRPDQGLPEDQPEVDNETPGGKPRPDQDLPPTASPKK